MTFFLYASMKSVRHVPLFLIAALPPMAACYSNLWRRAVTGRSRKSTLAILDAVSADLTPEIRSVSALGLVVFAIGLAVPGNFGMLRDFSQTKFPAALVAAHASELKRARLMTHDGWGDYLTFHGYPEQRIWIDGRLDLFGPKFGEEYFTMLAAEPGTEEILARWRFDAILIKPGIKLAAWLKTQPEWTERARDKSAVLFVKR
jgi:hypothetical protein